MKVTGPCVAALVLVLVLVLGACGNGVAGDAKAVEPVERSPARPLPATMPSPGATVTATPRAAAGQQDDATFLRTVSRELVGAGAACDGAAITAVRAGGSSCDATLVTARGATPVAWGKVGDLAPTDDDRTVTLPLTIDGAVRPLTMRSGAEAERVTSSLGLLATECQGG